MDPDDPPDPIPTRGLLPETAAPPTLRYSRWWWLLPGLLLALAMWVNLSPRPENGERYWLSESVGWDAAPLGGTLHGALCWHGIEVALFAPSRDRSGPFKARASANLLASWLRSGKLKLPTELHGEAAGSEYLIFGPSELVRIDGEMANALGPGAAHTELVGQYWLALLQDIILVRQGKTPQFLKTVEHTSDRPGCAKLLEQVVLKARGNSLEGPPSAESLIDAELSLSTQDHLFLVQSARHIPITSEP